MPAASGQLSRRRLAAGVGVVAKSLARDPAGRAPGEVVAGPDRGRIARTGERPLPAVGRSSHRRDAKKITQLGG